MSTVKTRVKEAAIKEKAKARFDARITRSQKVIFEEAARIKGFRSLSEFVIHTTLEVATGIIERHHAVIVSEKDQHVFFNAIVNPPKPNRDLIQAAKFYQKTVAAK